MRSFYFDLIATPRPRVWLRGVLFVGGLCAIAGVLGFERTVLFPELEAQRRLVLDQRNKMGSKPSASTMKPDELAKAWRTAQSAATELNLPWSRFFASLGQSSQAGEVALISIEPDTQKGQVLMVAEARNLESMLNFVSALQLSDEFTEVALQSHLINRAVPEHPVRFRLSTKWRTKP
jgi:hypothetical protein